jgi:hypothetical protein
MIQLKIGNLLKLSGKIKYFDIQTAIWSGKKKKTCGPPPIFKLF